MRFSRKKCCKRLLAAAYVVSGIMLLSAFTPKAVMSPEYNSGPFIFRISSVQFCDTATIIDAYFYGRPESHVMVDSTFYLSGASTGKTYALRSIGGLPVRTPVAYGDSCHIRASFVFEPLDAADSIFDFIEGNSAVEGAFDVYGVNLNPLSGKIRTVITGTVESSKLNDWLILEALGTDDRVDKTTVIPIEDGKFKYELHTADTLAYNIISGLDRLSGGWPNHYFFAEGNPVNIDMIGSDEPFWNKIKGGPLTNSLSDSYKMMQDIIDKSGVNKKEDVTRQEIDSVLNLTKEATLDFIKNDTTLTGLLLIYEKMIQNSTDQESAFDVFRDRYAALFPGHPYTVAIWQYLNGERVENGKKYPDFSAPDIDGNMHTLSNLIEGKFAVIDLWASWCGPCRRHSIELIPIYEKWKDKGFTIVGVARERGNTKSMEKAIHRDGYSWLNLVEINDQNGIWQKYGAASSGGKIILVSPAGKILAINPSSSDIEAILQALLK